MSLQQARERICQLEDAVRRLNSVKQHLSRNTAEICAEVRGIISRNQEFLHNRELALLCKVDSLRVMKEETLQLQQGRLNQAVNILRKAISLVQEDAASEKHLSDTLDRLNQLELSPEETPYIAFRADQLQMREQLLNFGRVDSNGLPPALAFEQAGKPSASLPRHLEEYEDADHHIFYKTIQEIKREPQDVTSITVSIPKLSPRIEDWLQPKSKTLNQCEEVPMMSDSESFPSQKVPVVRPSSLNTSGGNPSQVASPGSSNSLNNWLSFIKQHADLEEEHDFEIIDNSVKTVGESKQYASAPSDLHKWLSPSSMKSRKDSDNIFKHITKDKKVWLRQVSSQLHKLDDKRQVPDPFQHISREPSSWLRTRAGTRQDSNPDVSSTETFSHITKDWNKWLLAPKNMRIHADDDAEMTEPESSPVPAHQRWLLRGQARTHSQPSQMKNIQPTPMPLSEIPNNTSGSWLLSHTAPKITQAPEAKDFFSHIPSIENDVWLRHKNSLPCSPKHTPVYAEREMGPDQNSTNIWLLKKSNSEEQKLDKSPPKEWLFVPADCRSQNSTDVEITEEGDVASVSDGWSICSTPHSVTSDQYAKDIAIANDYYNKWLL